MKTAIVPPSSSSCVLVRKRDACSILGISSPTLDRWVRAGRIHRYKLGPNTSAYRLSEIEDFIKSSIQDASSAHGGAA